MEDRITFKTEEEKIKKLKIIAVENHTTVKAIMNKLIDDYLLEKEPSLK
jgi:hypothetical protein